MGRFQSPCGDVFGPAYDLSAEEMKIASKAFGQIKQKLLFQLTNFGNPIINVLDANYKNRSELLLEHVHEGIDLRMDYAYATLSNLYKIIAVSIAEKSFFTFKFRA